MRHLRGRARNPSACPSRVPSAAEHIPGHAWQRARWARLAMEVSHPRDAMKFSERRSKNCRQPDGAGRMADSRPIGDVKGTKPMSSLDAKTIKSAERVLHV